MPNHSLPSAGLQLREITRIIRRICLLEETDRNDEASRLQAAVLDPLIKSYRETHGAESLPDERIQGIESHELERAGNAAALGELLVPLLAEHLEGILQESGRSGRRAATKADLSAVLRQRPAATPEIADLLDGMLAQENIRPAPKSWRTRA